MSERLFASASLEANAHVQELELLPASINMFVAQHAPLCGGEMDLESSGEADLESSEDSDLDSAGACTPSLEECVSIADSPIAEYTPPCGSEADLVSNEDSDLNSTDKDNCTSSLIECAFVVSSQILVKSMMVDSCKENGEQ